MAEAMYFATLSKGDIHSITYAFPAHELTENQIELTKEEYYLLKSVHGANGNVLKLLREMLESMEMAVENLGRSK